MIDWSRKDAKSFLSIEFVSDSRLETGFKRGKVSIHLEHGTQYSPL